MKEVQWQDGEGYLRVSLLRDIDPDSMAPQGIPVPTLDLDELDWPEVKRSLHNALVKMQIFDWTTAQIAQGGLDSAIKRAVRYPLVTLFKLKHSAEQRNGNEQAQT